MGKATKQAYMMGLYENDGTNIRMVAFMHMWRRYAAGAERRG